MHDESLANCLEPHLRGLPAPEAEKSRAFRKVTDVSIYEVAAHPDLGDCLFAVAKHLDGVEEGVFYRYFAVRLLNGPIFGLARGMRTMSFRVGTGALEQSHGGQTDELLGPEWLKFDAWNPEVPTTQWLSELKQAASYAKKFTSEISAT